MKSLIKLLLFTISIPTCLVGQIKVEEIQSSVFHITIDGGKSSLKASLIKDGKDVVLVDLMNGDYSKAIKTYIEDNNLSIRLIINTHYHGDHIGGNSLFENVMILAHENTLVNLENGAPFGPPEPEKSKPNMLFKDQTIYFLGDTKVEVYHFGPAHTTGDAVVYVPGANVIMVGDVMLEAENTLPFAPNPEGAVKVLEAIASKIDDQTKVVTGHGQIGTKRNIVDLIEIMKLTINYVKSGKDVNSYPKEWDVWNSQYLTIGNWLKMLDQLYGK